MAFGITCSKLSPKYALVATSGDDKIIFLLSLHDLSIVKKLHSGGFLEAHDALWVSPNQLLECGPQTHLLLHTISEEVDAEGNR